MWKSRLAGALRYPGGVLVAILLLAIIAFTLTLRERPEYSPAIQGNSTLHQIVASNLDELNNRGTLSTYYCRSVVYPPDGSIADLNRIAPGHTIVRLYFRPRWWTQFSPGSAGPSSRQIHLAIRLSDGQSRFASEPLSNMKSYPDFLIWARARIHTEDDARVALAVLHHSRGIGNSSTTNLIACRDKTGAWQIGLQPRGCEEPRLTLITDQNGYVISGTVH